MPDSQDDNQDTRIPYEPPRLFDLGGGVAYAKGEDACTTGSVAAGKCKQGCIPGKHKGSQPCNGKGKK
jgi:hypothetical protein